MDPLVQFLLIVVALNVLMLPPFIWVCNRAEKAWEDWRDGK